jgi:molecular chaperone DnaJ
VVRVQGEGEPPSANESPDGTGVRGDLHIVVRVEEDARFERDGNDLLTTLDVSFATAALGGTVVVQTIDGESETDLSPGTQHGELFRLSGKGVPELGGPGRGDLIVAVRVQVPTKLSARQRELIEQLRDAEEPPKPRKGGKDAKEGGGAGKQGSSSAGGGRKRGGFWGKVKETFGD